MQHSHSTRAGSQDSLFIWTVAILILIGAALLCWIGGFYLFSHPEKPTGYRFLRKIGKLPDLERFVALKAPAGEFLKAAKLAERYLEMSPEKLASTNAELLRNYIKNYDRVTGLVPYATGKFVIVAARKLGKDTLFPHGAIAIAQSADNPDLFIEHVFPTASGPDADKAVQFLRPGLPLVLRSGDDLSAILNVERFQDGRLLFTIVPLLYATYSVGKTGAGFECSPPAELNIGAPRPIFEKSGELVAARAEASPRVADAIPAVGGREPAGAPSPAPRPPELAAQDQPSAPPVPVPVPAPAPQPTPTPAPVATPIPPPAVAVATPLPAAPGSEALPPAATPAPIPESPSAIAGVGQAPLQPFLGSTTPGGPEQPPPSWPLFARGEAPARRTITVDEAVQMADTGPPKGATYLGGDFVVNAQGPGKAVLRPRDPVAVGAPAGSPGGLQPFLAGPQTAAQRAGVRVIVAYPPGIQPPPEGAPVSHDGSRPLEIVEITRASNGTINIHAREITAP